MWLFAPNLRAVHGFSTRSGGVSDPPFASLNFDDREDDPERVGENRRLALAALGFEPGQVARLHQVHGTNVVRAAAGVQTADALISDRPGLPLVIGAADCYPLLLEDAGAGVVGAAHAGWKGTLGGVARRTVEAMRDLGARPERIHVAIGPGICGACYEVGPAVARAFEEAGLSEAVCSDGVETHLDLQLANTRVLEQAGVPSQQLWSMDRCSTEPDFFSYRRDGGRTGRMWALICSAGLLTNGD